MKVMGLDNLVHWCGWFITSFAVAFATMVVLTVLLKVGKVLEYTNAFITFIFVMLYVVATISQCFLISCFFSKANLR